MLQLQDNFISVVTATKIHFSEKEMKSSMFLNRLRITLTTLRLSAKFKRLLFLRKKKKAIERTKGVCEIFYLLEDYWNWSDYDLLQKLITDFGDETLQQKMTMYLTQLENFEKNTSVLEFKRVVKRKQKCPYDFTRIVIKLKKDSSECTMHEVRKLKEAAASESAIEAYALHILDIHASSVVVTLAFPRDTLELLPPVLSNHFLATYHITSVTIDDKPLEEYTEVYVKVS